MKLSLRLETILNKVPNSVTADVGSDHGKLMIALVERGIIPFGYAIENKKGPFTRLVNALKEAGMDNKIKAMFSDGISELPSDVSTVVIAGMGGQNIIDILTSHQEKLKNVETIIVDAHSCIPKLREKVTKMGYIVADEQIVKDDNKFYEIIKFIRGENAVYSDNDFVFGPILRNQKSSIFKEKYENRIHEIDYIMSKSSLSKERIHELQQEKERIINNL